MKKLIFSFYWVRIRTMRVSSLIDSCLNFFHCRMPTRPIDSVFRNPKRLDAIRAALDAGDEQAMRERIASRTENARLLRLLNAKDMRWIELKEDVVYRVVGREEEVVVKIFGMFPFHEIGGNLLATGLLDTCPFFVRTLDIGRDMAGKYLIIMESLPEETSSLALDEPINMYNLFYQTAYACAQMEKAGGLQHFDLRLDNIMMRRLSEPKDLFHNGIKTDFVIKIGDFGQCEFDIAGNRPRNPDVPRNIMDQKRWGVYPTVYTGYDFQYFLSTLTPVLEEYQSFYYIHQMAVTYLEPIASTAAQDRPEIITRRRPTDILAFLKREITPTLGI